LLTCQQTTLSRYKRNNRHSDATLVLFAEQFPIIASQSTSCRRFRASVEPKRWSGEQLNKPILDCFAVRRVRTMAARYARRDWPTGEQCKHSAEFKDRVSV